VPHPRRVFVFAPRVGWHKPGLPHVFSTTSNEHSKSGDLTAAGTPDAVIEGIESPFDPGDSRSVVAIHLRDASTLEPFMDTFMKVQQSSDISGSVSVLHGAQYQSFRIGSEVYHVGVLPWWTRLNLWFMQVSWLAAVVVIVLAFLLAIWTRQWLRGRDLGYLNRVQWKMALRMKKSTSRTGLSAR
jgi:hypothetical protein